MICDFLQSLKLAFVYQLQAFRGNIPTKEPLSVISNLGYLFAALFALFTDLLVVKWLVFISLTYLFAGSTLYHATGLSKYGHMDEQGMYLVGTSLAGAFLSTQFPVAYTPIIIIFCAVVGIFMAVSYNRLSSFTTTGLLFASVLISAFLTGIIKGVPNWPWAMLFFFVISSLIRLSQRHYFPEDLHVPSPPRDAIHMVWHIMTSIGFVLFLKLMTYV
ncbi:MAG: hypothetical protein D6698_01645 [Gammaproteobacteria bacterium]|nr:MAG: hypothetical protein D6698_01645 [Gammaproteobacteria bacterium]